MKKGLYEKILNIETAKELGKDETDTRNVDSNEVPRALSLSYQKIIRQALKNIDDKDERMSFIQSLNNLLEAEDLLITDKGLNELLAYSDDIEELETLKKHRPKTSIADSTLFTGTNGPSLDSELRREIRTADEVYFLVSFIKWSGLRLIFDDLKELTKTRKLKVITTSYMGASDYKAIQSLAKLPNTEVKISYDTKRTRLHAKSYLFKRDTGFSTAYIGSSNMSNAAMTSGLEWNLKVSQYTSPDVILQIEKSFESYWADGEFTLFNPDEKEKVIELQSALEDAKTGREEKHYYFDLRPYSHQEQILEDLAFERQEIGSYRNLVVAATGTGKTMIAAFDYKNQLKNGPKKLLFLAHRKEILEQSLESFRAVLRDYNFGGLLVGGQSPSDPDHIFASIQSLNSDEKYKNYDPSFFDYIVIDETHHASADSYEGILTYFDPEILLGLTATPERMDGQDITIFFNNRIASEIRLGDAIERKLLSPFHYFAVTDSPDVNLSNLSWTQGGYDTSELEKIYTSSKIRVQLIIDALDRYLTNPDQMKTLGFCVSIKHAEYMANAFNQADIPSMAIHGNSSVDDRSSAKEKLKMGEINCIFTVDLFNEGVDIPEIDTVLFLRPTESLTIFIQQLGRGLRLSEDKEALTVLDFVGQAHKNYDFSFKFRALVGKTKRPLKEEIEEDFPNLPAGCHIHLEKQAKEYILRNIPSSTGDLRSLRKMMLAFPQNFDQELNMKNFLDLYEIDENQFYAKERSFYSLAHDVGLKDTYEVNHPKEFKASLRRMSSLNSKRLIHFSKNYLKGDLSTEAFSEKDLRLLNMLYYTIWTDPQKEDYKTSFRRLKEDNYDIYQEILDILSYNALNLKIIEKEYEDSSIPLDIYGSYTINQILSAFGKNDNYYKYPLREGVHYIEEYNTDLFFITINKMEADYLPTTMYNDYAINNELFHWESQSNTSVDSPTGQRYIKNEEGHKVLLFVRENKQEYGASAPYIFLGNASYVSHTGSKPIQIIWKMDHEIPERIIQESGLRVI